MTDRTVKVGLVAETATFDGPMLASSKIVGNFATSNQAAAAAAKAASAEAVAGAQAIAAAEKTAAVAAKDAAATATSAKQALTAAQKEAAAAAKEAAAAETASAKAVTDEEIASAAAAKEAATQRVAAAEAGVVAAEKDAASAAAASVSAKEFAASQRDVAAAAKEAATASKASATVLAEVAAQEAAEAKASADATATREAAYKKAGTAVTTMAAGFGLAAGLMVKSAGDFQSSTTHLVTDAGESQDKLAMVQAGILKTSVDTGTSASALVDAMYHIESAGFHGKTGLDMLTVAAEGAKVGNADLGTVAKTLTGTMNSYSEAGYTSTQMMNMLIATTAAGDLKMNDLAGSLGNVAPIAAAAGIKFSEVGGAIATMTAQNMSADRATQDLANTINALQKPSNIAVQQMQAMGLSSNDVSSQLGTRGLTGTLEVLTTAIANHTQNGQVFIDTMKSSANAAADMKTMLGQLPPSIQGISKQLMDGTITTSDYNKQIGGLDASNLHLAKQFEGLAKSSGSFNDLLKSGKPEAETFNAALSNMLGGATGLNTALMLTGGRMETFKDSTAKVADAATKGGGAVDNWAAIQGTFNQKMDVAKASIGAAGIAIGTALLPAVSELAKWITDIVKPIAEWVDKHQQLTAYVLGSVAAVSALTLMIAAAVKTCALIKVAVEGVTTAVGFFKKSATEATVATEAMGAANAAAAVKTEAAAASTAGWASKLGGSIPILGAVIAGTVALGSELGKLSGVGDHTGQDATKLTTQLLEMGTGSAQATKSMQDFAVQMAVAGKMMHETDHDNASATQGMKDLDKSVADMVSGGHPQQAAAAFGPLQDALVKQGFSLGYIHDQLFPQYNKALGDAANTQREAAAATDGGTKSLGANADATKGLADATGAATDATNTQTDAQKAQAAGAQQLAAITSRNTGGVLAFMMATAAANDTAAASTEVTKAATSTTASNTSVKSAATTATNAQTSANKSLTTASKDTAKANADQAKANDLGTAAAKASADATALDGSATATAAEKKKAHALATSTAAAATRANTTAVNADDTAANAVATSTEKATKATDAKAKATATSQKASEQEAAAQQAAAIAAANAAFEHDIGTTALKAWATAAFDTQHATDKLDASVGAEVSAMKDAKAKSNELKDALDALNGVHISAGKAAIDVQSKIADLTKTLQDNGKTLDITTDKGRVNMTQVYDTAAAINAHAQAVADESHSIYAGNQALAASRDEFDKVLVHAGLSADEIRKFNDTILQTPKLATIDVSANISGAMAAIKTVFDAASNPAVINFKGGAKAMASGGLVMGPGSETSDSVPAMLSRNEFVLNAAATRAIGADQLTKWNSAHGGAVASVVKPQFVTRVGGTTPQPSAGGAALHVEHYHEAAAGGGVRQTADELAWLLKARG